MIGFGDKNIIYNLHNVLIYILIQSLYKTRDTNAAMSTHFDVEAWASCQIRKIAGFACAGNAGNDSPPPTSKETVS